VRVLAGARLSLSSEHLELDGKLSTLFALCMRGGPHGPHPHLARTFAVIVGFCHLSDIVFGKLAVSGGATQDRAQTGQSDVCWRGMATLAPTLDRHPSDPRNPSLAVGVYA
jgi:hypothetical protein